jgi:hypothetical protein
MSRSVSLTPLLVTASTIIATQNNTAAIATSQKRIRGIRLIPIYDGKACKARGKVALGRLMKKSMIAPITASHGDEDSMSGFLSVDLWLRV